MPNEVQDLLIAQSGGVLSILFSLCYNACVAARARKSSVITKDIAQIALNDRRERFNEGLDEEDFETLNQKLPSRMPKKDDRFLRTRL